MQNIQSLKSKQIDSTDLKTIEAEMPSAYILSVEPMGGGANIYGPFEQGEALEANALLVDEYLQDEIHIRPISEAVEAFCD